MPVDELIFPDTEEVTGSSPVSPTTKIPYHVGDFRFLRRLRATLRAISAAGSKCGRRRTPGRTRGPPSGHRRQTGGAQVAQTVARGLDLSVAVRDGPQPFSDPPSGSRRLGSDNLRTTWRTTRRTSRAPRPGRAGRHLRSLTTRGAASCRTANADAALSRSPVTGPRPMTSTRLGAATASRCQHAARAAVACSPAVPDGPTSPVCARRRVVRAGYVILEHELAYAYAPRPCPASDQPRRPSPHEPRRTPPAARPSTASLSLFSPTVNPVLAAHRGISAPRRYLRDGRGGSEGPGGAGFGRECQGTGRPCTRTAPRRYTGARPYDVPSPGSSPGGA